jgi:hypothetical protein
LNNHFASGNSPTKEQYEHGIQVIDEEKEFKYAEQYATKTPFIDRVSVPTLTHIFNSPKPHSLASIIILSRFLAPSQQANLPFSTTYLGHNSE